MSQKYAASQPSRHTHRQNATRVAIASAIALALSLAQHTARAAGDMSSLRGSPRFDLHIDLDLREAYGVGGRVEFPIVPAGLLQSADDDLTLSLGAEVFFSHGRYNTAVWPLGALQWNFYLSESWSVFPELGVVAFAGDDHYRGYAPNGPFVSPYLGLGARLHLSPRAALLARVNWPAGFQFGVAF
ncbi:MAG: hypothetical protein SFV15_10410 [Polyangiaceae bacterium]|nr:hypothetical protein [Polyangiaceae bacterium]